MASIESIYIFTYTNKLLLEYNITKTSPPIGQTLAIYLSYPLPRPNFIQCHDLSLPTVLCSLSLENIFIISPITFDVDPFSILEFLHQFKTLLVSKLGSPLIPSKIASSYNVITHLLFKMIDGQLIACTELNSFFDGSDDNFWAEKILGDIRGFPSSIGHINPESFSLWRRPNVLHTFNELAVNIVENLISLYAPSGRLIYARVTGQVHVKCCITGVPNVLLKLKSRQNSLNSFIPFLCPTFHPCVRIARWQSDPGTFSFIPPDGSFLLATYEVDLAKASDAINNLQTESLSSSTFVSPFTLEINKYQGAMRRDFSVTLFYDPRYKDFSVDSNLKNSPLTLTIPSSKRSKYYSTALIPQGVSVRILLSASVCNVTEMRTSIGDVKFNLDHQRIEWHIADSEMEKFVLTSHKSPTEILPIQVATLYASAAIPEHDSKSPALDICNQPSGNDDVNAYSVHGNSFSSLKNNSSMRLEDFTVDSKQILCQSNSELSSTFSSQSEQVFLDERLMPLAVNINFRKRGWLASGLIVEAFDFTPLESKEAFSKSSVHKQLKTGTSSKYGIEYRC